jgi:hypothetical protein
MDLPEHLRGVRVLQSLKRRSSSKIKHPIQPAVAPDQKSRKKRNKSPSLSSLQMQSTPVPGEA